MKVVETKYSDYIIKTDTHPYTESKKILSELDFWWDQSNRKHDKNNSANYNLASDKINSITVSLSSRLRKGCFSFVYYKEQVILYSGLYIKNNIAYVHRLASDPLSGVQHLGVFSGILMPYQIKYAYESRCVSYIMAFNQQRFKLYNYFKASTFNRNKLIKFNDGNIFLAKLDYKGLQILNTVPQYICSLDLTASDTIAEINKLVF